MPSPDPAVRPHAVLDFDGVVVRHDSTVELLRRRLRARPWLLPVAAGPLVGYAVTSVAPPLRAPASLLVVRAALVGSRRADVEEAAWRLGAELAADPAWRVDAAVDVMRAHLAEGDVTVVSAGLAVTVRAFLDALGLAEVRVVASRIAGGIGGSLLTDHTYGAHKVVRAAAAGITAWDHAYTDAASDFPLLERARHRHLVNARRPVVAAARLRWPDVEVLTW
ncbi:haloacid dehalogenase-like hydrolase [Nocardioides sp. ChNu-99]|uniref:haloacid dehalogenase-like hydrolase n=1 Tax=Nocardioides sp. ChNu-99 TaxID=2839897 RepID=UPI0024068D2E|nr:haloacid dehalogenase-like hydrolase [Nocardioides sp. ChNu-99]MDF9717066.1 haloacid dehalogenase-like hydrolase [Nocardioides sp. ChNu-99]